MTNANGGSRVHWLAFTAVLVLGGGLLWWAIESDKPQWAWLVSLLLVAVVLFLCGYDAVGVPRGIFIDRRYVISLSRVQVVLWTVLVVSAILAAGLWNLHKELDALSFTIPGELWALMGISTASSVGASLIISNKEASPGASEEQFNRQASLSGTPAAPAADLIRSGVLVTNKTPQMARWSDMITGDESGNFASIDISKVQMLLFTVIAVLVYGLSLWTLFQALTVEGGFTEFPEFDKSILTLIGISHAGYLSYKASPHSEPAGTTKQA